MGTALVMEHANALAQMIVSEKDKLFDERVEALVKLYRRAEFYLKQGFLESIVCEFHRKKVEMIMQAETKGEITEILKLSKPHFDGKKFVYTSPYAVEEEELRKKLKVDSRNWNYIRTVRGVGYKFNHSQGSNILWEFFCHICCTFLS